ncbi:MAG: DUF362 domain-containing protein [Ignavibacteriales bacterium]|nr:MAG: DUF362 domain-containing protein [Ignavibacteriales bacterium]
MLKYIKSLLLIGLIISNVNILAAPQGLDTEKSAATNTGNQPIVYMTKNITPDGLMAVYNALNHKLPGKVAVKISTGEPGGKNFLSPDLIKELVHEVNGTIVECNTAYGGPRSTTESHKKVAEDHGFTAIANVDILDEDSSISLPFDKGVNIKEDFVGSHFRNYDSFIILSHFKGHQMGGFGGAIKNMSIGIASAGGKVWIHTAGLTDKTTEFMKAFTIPQDKFLESMAEAAGAIIESLGNKILYISVMNNLSIDCDCNNNPTKPTMNDIGILSSDDPVALDQACVDLVYKAHDGHDLIKRMEEKNAIHTLEHGEMLGIGSRTYELVIIE